MGIKFEMNHLLSGRDHRGSGLPEPDVQSGYAPLIQRSSLEQNRNYIIIMISKGFVLWMAFYIDFRDEICHFKSFPKFKNFTLF